MTGRKKEMIGWISLGTLDIFMGTIFTAALIPDPLYYSNKKDQIVPVKMKLIIGKKCVDHLTHKSADGIH